MGYSLGSFVALQTAIRHPGVVDGLVLVAGTMRRDGSYPEVAAFNQLEANAAMLGGSVKASPLGHITRIPTGPDCRRARGNFGSFLFARYPDASAQVSPHEVWEISEGSLRISARCGRQATIRAAIDILQD